MQQSKVIQNKGGVNIGSPYALPGYEYDPVTDKFKDLSNGKIFDSSDNAKIEPNKNVTVTENGESIITPSATYDGLKKVTLNVEVPVPTMQTNKQATIDVSTYTEPVEVTPVSGADGMMKATITLENVPQIEANKAASIDVSGYTEPVEITPTEGKDGMAKATVTLSNIPSGGLRLYQFLLLSYGTNSSYPFWCASQEPEIGDIIAGSGYEGVSLEERYSVLAVKTVAEVKASSTDWAYFFNNHPGYDDASKCYSIDDGYDDYFILATDKPGFTPSVSSPAYIDF